MRGRAQAEYRSLMHYIVIRPGGAAECHRLDRWISSVYCASESPAAARLLTDIRALGSWPTVATSSSPFFLPKEFADLEEIDASSGLFMVSAEHEQMVGVRGSRCFRVPRTSYMRP